MTKENTGPKKIKPVIVELELSRDLLPGEISVLNTLNKKYSDKEISLTFNDQTLSARLVRLDPAKYERSINEYISRADLAGTYEEEKNPFLLLLEKINAIGSYGIRYGKRIYAGYADERKVTGRKEKAKSCKLIAKNKKTRKVRGRRKEKAHSCKLKADSKE